MYQLDRHRIQQCLRDIEPDVVQGFGTEAGYGYAAATSGYPAIVRVQGIQSAINAAVPLSVLLSHPRFFVPVLFERLTVRRCYDYICPTMFAARFVQRLNPDARIHIVKTPVRAEAFSVRREAAPPDAPELIFVGSVIGAKGVEVLLGALQDVARRHPRVMLHIVGAGEESYMAGTLVPMLDRLGIRDHVVFHGYLPAASLAPLWARAAILVLPTFMDTAPNVVAEAQVAGVPVVASAVGGVPEMVEHDVTGLLVPPGAIEPLSSAILRLIEDPEMASRLAAAAQARARLEHRPDEQVKKLVDVYREVAVAAVGRARLNAALERA